MDELFTTHQLSRMLRMDPSTVGKWIDRGLLAAFRTPGGHRRVRAEDLRRFLVAHRMPLPPELGMSTLKMLIVDEDRASLDGLKRALKTHGGRVEATLTTSFIEGVLLVGELRPDALVLSLDERAPEVVELLRKLAGRSALRSVRVLTIARDLKAEAVERARRAGAAGALERPVSAEALLEALAPPFLLLRSIR